MRGRKTIEMIIQMLPAGNTSRNTFHYRLLRQNRRSGTCIYVELDQHEGGVVKGPNFGDRPVTGYNCLRTKCLGRGGRAIAVISIDKADGTSFA